jgi:aspartate 1-decarboxylase
MLLKVLRTKLHRARVTQADIDYVGSIAIDPDLYEAVGMVPGENVLVADLANGNRFETYVLAGARGTGQVCVNGAAARLVRPGDHVIVMSWAYVTPEEAPGLKPRIALVDENNRVARML